MGTSLYPANIDVVTNPLSTDPMNSSTVEHAAMHTLSNDAMKAVQTTLGKNPQGTYQSVAARLDAASYTGHKHVVADITGLQTALNGKAATAHKHAPADINSVTGTGTLSDDLSARPTHGTSAPKPLGPAAVIGVSNQSARADHVHPLPSLASLGAASSGVNITAGTGLTGGGTLAASRTLSVNFPTSGGENGVAVTASRGDHNHDSRYYTKAVADSTFSKVNHNHDGVYARVIYQDAAAPIPDASGYPSGTILAIYS